MRYGCDDPQLQFFVTYIINGDTHEAGPMDYAEAAEYQRAMRTKEYVTPANLSWCEQNPKS